MPKKPNQKIKLLYLMEILQQNTDDEHGMSLAELSEALERRGVEAERKTLYDDIETLRLFGLDVEKRRTDTVRYFVASRDFELPELKLLVDAVQSSKFITAKKSENGVVMRSLLAKDRLYRMLNSLTINVTDIGSLFSRTSRDILPYPNKLSICQRSTVSVCNDKIRF